MPRPRPPAQLPRLELLQVVLLQTAPPGALRRGLDQLPAGLLAEGAVDPALGGLAVGQVEPRYCPFLGGDVGNVLLLGVEDNEIVEWLDAGLSLAQVLGVQVVDARNIFQR